VRRGVIVRRNFFYQAALLALGASQFIFGSRPAAGVADPAEAVPPA
jgi:hypothetical protein